MICSKCQGYVLPDAGTDTDIKDRTYAKQCQCPVVTPLTDEELGEVSGGAGNAAIGF